ncbi:juvenile hormone esterase-like [Rhodnius prolixus]|uniref:juvenile hormone esterase-like n=1 Tax=Rhodnius prolixus TaxID=13249 RepID=UPI003D18ABA4
MDQFQIIVKLLLVPIIFTKCNHLIVNTTQGLLRGREFKSRNGRTVAAFSGIQFAKPPLGRLRFQDPQPPEVWSGIKDAYKFGDACVQIPSAFRPVNITRFGSEDCLYLSVYTPNTQPSKLFPVFVYLYGGDFAYGSGEIDKSPEYFMDYDIVMVMPNYRVGPLGFLSLQDDVIAGNMGLKDQVMALVWVRNNIANFGGDPGQVTLIGESAGGVSVHYHMYSPMSRGLFHKAISQSGVAFASWANPPSQIARSRAINFAQLLNCSVESSEVILNCLRTKDAFEISELYINLTKQIVDHLMVPIVDTNSSNPFLPINPLETEPLPIPWIVGTVTFEGFPKSADYIRNESKFNDLDQNFYEELPKILFYENTALHPREITQKLREFYFDGKQITKDVLKNLTDMFSDNRVLSPSIQALKQQKGPQYLYYFNYIGKVNFQKVLTGKMVLKGAAHLDDTIYIWKINNPLKIAAPATCSDLNLSHLLVKLFVNFAYFGNPTPQGSEFTWPRWDNQEQNFVSFDNRGVKLCSKFIPERMKLWDGLRTRDKVDKTF